MDLPKVVVDFSTFSNANTGEVLVKELTFVDIETKCSQHFIFSPPDSLPGNWCSSHRDVWLSQHFHGIDFNAGFTRQESLHHVLNQHVAYAKFILAPTRAKAKILEKLVQRRRLILDLETLGCPPVPREGLFPVDSDDDYGVDEVDSTTPETSVNSRPCLYHRIHSPGCVCTLSNAMFLTEWCAANLHLIDMNDAKVREKTFVDWKLTSPSVKDLADSGFVRVSTTKDSTLCLYCGLVLHQWEEGDKVEADHLFNSPYCKLLRFKCQLRREDSGRSAHTSEEFYNRYGACKDLTEEDLFKLCNA